MFILTQVLFLFYTLFSVKEEYYATSPYRKYVAQRTEDSEKYHFWNALTTLAVLISISVLYEAPILNKILAFIVNGLIYWLIFDIGYAMSINKEWYYLGNEARTDRTIKKYLGENGVKQRQ